jgi:hypothetical protein
MVKAIEAPDVPRRTEVLVDSVAGGCVGWATHPCSVLSLKL